VQYRRVEGCERTRLRSCLLSTAASSIDTYLEAVRLSLLIEEKQNGF